MENLPRILVDAWRDNSLEITFTGTQVDFDDLKTAFDTADQNVKVSFKFVKRADVADVEKAIDDIFADMVSEMRTEYNIITPMEELIKNDCISPFRGMQSFLYPVFLYGRVLPEAR